MNKGKTRLIAESLLIAGLLLIVFAMLNPSSMMGGNSGMMGGQSNTFSIAEMLLAIVGASMMAAGVVLLIFKEEYEPLGDSTLIPSADVQAERTKVREEPRTEPSVIPPSKNSATASSDDSVDERLLVLRLLTGDERAMFRAIVESGGEALQKDLIVKTKMSDAKVSRVLDRLVEKGVISKVRHGVTNKVRIEIEA